MPIEGPARIRPRPEADPEEKRPVAPPGTLQVVLAGLLSRVPSEPRKKGLSS